MDVFARGRDFGNTLTVDLLDDLQMTRQYPAEHVQGPTLQGFGEQGVVRITEALPGDLPGPVPGHPVLVESLEEDRLA